MLNYWLEFMLQRKGQKYYNCPLPPKELLEPHIPLPEGYFEKNSKKNPSPIEDGLNNYRVGLSQYFFFHDYLSFVVKLSV